MTELDVRPHDAFEFVTHSGEKVLPRHGQMPELCLNRLTQLTLDVDLVGRARRKHVHLLAHPAIVAPRGREENLSARRDAIAVILLPRNSVDQTTP